MASLLKGIKNFLREKKDQAAEELADPVRDGKFAIEDSEKQLAEFVTQISRFSADIKIQERQLAEKQAEVKKFMNLAKKAAEAGNEDDVKMLIAEKQRVDTEVKTVKAEITKNHQILNGIKNQKTAMKNKIAQAKSNFTQLQTRQKSAKIRKGLASASAGLDSNSAFAQLDDLETAVISSECEAESLEEMAGESNVTVSLEDKYGSSDSDVDDEVAKLMASAKKD